MDAKSYYDVGRVISKDERRGGKMFDDDVLECFLENLRRNHGLSDSFAQLFKQISVLRTFDAFRVGTEQFDLAFFQHSLFGKLHGCGCRFRGGSD